MNIQRTNNGQSRGAVIGSPVDARAIRIGAGFDALGFKHEAFAGLMDPLIMVDHYTMTEPTFGPHGHAGISAVSILFEDSVGVFNNRDSLGNDIDLLPGDLYWLKAGKGGLHDEKPTIGSKTHGLQLFVNLPATQKFDDPSSLHVKVKDMPVIEGDDHRVRVVLGQSNQTKGVSSPVLPLTILDAQFNSGGRYVHHLPKGHGVWVHPVSGDALVTIAGVATRLTPNQALALQAIDATAVELSSPDGGQVVLIEGQSIKEKFVQRGPFAMSTLADIEAVTKAFRAGEFGTIAD
ncbi:pirin family protein [Hyphococcus sp. DH-69]|uniref:pirin family protein n=1 Tax=Hyphococcus formosus TaxID=3143534 RepID=UPI00398AF50E